MDSVFNDLGVQILLPSKNNDIDPKKRYRDAFLKIKETLTRIGIASSKSQTLYQTCHLLHKQNQYAILHFKELFALDGKANTFTEEDRLRRNKIVSLLAEWDLCEVIEADKIKDQGNFTNLKILKHSEKEFWELKTKYAIGQKNNS